MAGPGTSPSFWEREFHNVKLAKPASIPFLSDELMDGLPPDCSFKAFKRPQLRRCPFNLETIDWPRSRRIDGGLDGSILKIYFQGSDIPYCLKIFWDPEAGFGGVAQFAVERECINASVLQKMETSVEEAVTGSSPPILINPNPKTKEDAIDNIYGFSREGRQAGLSSLSKVDYEPMSVTSMPRMRKCYGWVKIDAHSLLEGWPRRVRPSPVQVGKFRRSFQPGREYFAIVYEWIEEEDNDPATVQAVDTFLYRAGFCHQAGSHVDNWKGGVLLDLSDYVYVFARWWRRMFYEPREVDNILQPHDQR